VFDLRLVNFVPVRICQILYALLTGYTYGIFMGRRSILGSTFRGHGPVNFATYMRWSVQALAIAIIVDKQSYVA
jgi:uncharacterized membrane protein